MVQHRLLHKAIPDRLPEIPDGATTNGGGADPRSFGLVKAAYGVRETLELLSIGRTSLYAAVKRGELTPIKFGNKTLFYATDLAGFLMRLKHPVSKSAQPQHRSCARNKLG
jgi:excisionase family DNA binding protein